MQADGRSDIIDISIGISIWYMGYRYGIWYIDTAIYQISMGISIWYMGYQYGICYIDVVIYHIDMVILHIDFGYGLMICEMTVSIWSFSISLWDILSLWVQVDSIRTRVDMKAPTA